MNTQTYITGTAILATLGIVFGIIFGIIFYLLFSYSLYMMVKKRNMPNPWLAWIPVVNMYCIGKMTGDMKIFNLSLTNTEIILPLAFALFIGLAYVPLVGAVLSAIGLLVLVIAFHKLYEEFDPENAFVLTIITAIIPVVAAPIIMFINRNK
ncbi:MAG: hypothetical protein JXB33_00240 [Clostridia bacterium]|nr:hypothetical protein [Clostridia bacterium]